MDARQGLGQIAVALIGDDHGGAGFGDQEIGPGDAHVGGQEAVTQDIARLVLQPARLVDHPVRVEVGVFFLECFDHLFLQHMETLFGRENFDNFLAAYFKHFEFQSISSEVFLDYLDQNLLLKYPDIFSRSQAEEWLYKPGLPADSPIPHSETLTLAARMANSWVSGETAVTDIPLSDWSPQAAVYFINSLPIDLSEEKLIELDTTFGFSQSRNAEIGRTWFIQVASRRHLPAYEAMEQHLNRYGRTRLVQPVYIALAKNGEDAELAAELFAGASDKYHPLTIASIEFGLDSVNKQ